MKIKYDVYKHKDSRWDDIFCPNCDGYLYSRFMKYNKEVGCRPFDGPEWTKCPHCNCNIN